MSGSDLLPPGWAEVTVGDLFEELRAKVPADPNSPLPFIGMDHVESDTMRLLGSGRFAEMKSAGTRFHSGDVLYGRLRPYLNKVLKADFEGVSSAEFLVFPQVPAISNDFLKFVLTDRAFVAFASHPDNVTGDRPRIDFDTISKYRLNLPPYPEQARIVSRIEELFSDLDTGEESLRRAQAQLKRYRQSVLKAAVTGELTRAWREQNADKLESGEALLKRILKARREAWEQAELEKLRVKGKRPTDNAWKSRYVEPQGPNTEGLPELPQGWAWATFNQLGEFGRGKSKHRPRNDPRLFGGPYPFLQTGTVRASKGRIRSHDSTLSEFGLAQSKLWPAGTICITIAANIAESGILDYPACFPDSVVGLVPSEGVVTEYIEFFIRTAREKLDRYAPATAQKNINLEILEKVAVPLPSKREQEEIYSLAWERLSAIDAVEGELARQFAAAAALRQSILKAAFSGKLVPQDSNEEPAKELLKRIAAERTAQGARPARSGAPRSPRKARAATQPSAPAPAAPSAAVSGLAAARKAAGLSQAQLAAAIGINQAYVSQMETGKRAMTADQVAAIAKALGIEPSALTQA